MDISIKIMLGVAVGSLTSVFNCPIIHLRLNLC